MIRVLIIEDDPPTSSLLTRMVKRIWPQASVAVEDEPVSALEYWRDFGADLILLDWGLPGISGIDLLKQIRKFNRKVACVMITGYSDRDKILAARAQQVDAYIAKPFDAIQVMQTLSKIMDKQEDEPEQPEEAAETSIEDFIQRNLSEGTLSLPIDHDLANSVAKIRDMEPEKRIETLRRCQVEPSLVFRLLSLANSSHYIQDAEVAETFEVALRRIGLGGFLNLAVELSLYPGSNLNGDVLIEKRGELQRDTMSLIGVVSKLKDHVDFDLAACRNACLISRAGELSLLQIMQAWLDEGHRLDASTIPKILKNLGPKVTEHLRAKWILPLCMRERIDALTYTPAGVIRTDQVIMRIANLLNSGDPDRELPRLLGRFGLGGKILASDKT